MIGTSKALGSLSVLRFATVALVLLGSGCSRKAKICTEWAELGMPQPEKILECSPMRFHATGYRMLNARVFEAIRVGLERAGFQPVRGVMPNGSVEGMFRRERDGRQLRVNAQSDVLVETSTEKLFDEDAMKAKAAAYMESLRPVLAAFRGAKELPPRCEDAELLRIEPGVGARNLTATNVTKLHEALVAGTTDAKEDEDAEAAEEVLSPVPLRSGLPTTVNPEGSMIEAQARLEEILNAKIMILYKVLESKPAEPDAAAKGKLRGGSFSGLFVVFDRPNARVLCGTKVTATHAPPQLEKPSTPKELRAQLSQQIGVATVTAVQAMSPLLKLVPSSIH